VHTARRLQILARFGRRIDKTLGRCEDNNEMSRFACAEKTIMAAGVITCPECDKKFKGKGDLQGKKVRCPFCKESFTVPDEDDEEEHVQAGKPKAKAAALEPAGDKEVDDIDPYGAQEQDLAPRCPNCANEMESENATICLYCGYNTLTRQWGKTVKTVAHTKMQIFLHLLPGIGAFVWMLMIIIGLLYYCLVLPLQVSGSWLGWLDHESLRMWFTIIAMGFAWGTGMFLYRRFFVEPLPPEIRKD
jgi:hypothetical protein